MPLPLRLPAIAALLVAAPLSTALAQSSASPPTVTVTGYIQPQYERLQVEEAARDRAIFRRLYLGVQTTIAKNWSGTILIDFAPLLQDDRIGIGDVLLRYNGVSGKGLTFSLGHQKIPFSRSILMSSRSRSLVERPFTGERAFGAPGRGIGAQVDGRHADQRFQWSASLASVMHAPNAQELRLSGIADAEDTWNEGVMVVGRAEWHPLGPVAREQGDFERGPFRVMGGLSAYAWTNDGDRNLFTRDGVSSSPTFADLDAAQAVEVSGGLRGHGVSVDAAWSRVQGETIDPQFTGGIYVDGRASLHETAVEAGYMVILSRLEALASLDSLAIDARSATAYRPSFGAVWYVDGHRLKFSAMHRQSVNVLGVRGARGRQTYLQAQYGF
ncbi:MAG TPA: porin [Vicinamibacterales bacterium]|nr:porin [Vicinamibacterales bacterium]